MRSRIAFLLGLAFAALPLFAQLNENCTITVLNRSVQAGADGSWVLPNVPANAGLVRARATCVENGVTRSGQSDYFLVPANGLVEVAQIRFDAPTPIARSLTLHAPSTLLTAAGVTTRATAIAAYSDGTTADVSSAAYGTNFFTSNARVATAGSDGIITAQSSGTALISAMNEGALGMITINVVTGADSDGDGIPDQFEIDNGLDPNNPADALTDLDADGLSNVDEFRRGTDLRKADSDGDGLADGQEVQVGTNPLLRDSDGDGVSDGLAVQSGSNPLDPNSYNLASVLRRLDVTPASLDIIVNTVLGEASRLVKVTGTLSH